MTSQSTNTTPDSGANNQPTVNKQLDEIVADLSGESFDAAINNPNDYAQVIIDAEVKAKQAFTSLIKELVAEAEPGIHPYLDNEIDGGYAQAIHRAGILNYQNNLLKALEEK